MLSRRVRTHPIKIMLQGTSTDTKADRKGKEGIGGRYAVFDVEYELESGEGTRSKISMLHSAFRTRAQLTSDSIHLLGPR
jgi:hypothetical protein